MKEQAQEKHYYSIMGSVIMIGRRIKQNDQYTAGDVERNVDHIKLMIEKYDWTGHDISAAQQIIADHG